MVGALLLLLAAPGRLLSAEPEGGEREAVSARPLVVMKQTEISGQIYFLRENPEKGRAGVEVKQAIKIELHKPNQDNVACATVTDAKGHFVLPNLDVGTYHMIVGRLEVDLKVVEPQASSDKAKPLPKTIVIFIPTEVVD